MAKVFFSYSHADTKIRSEIDKHFSVLKRAKEIETWYDRKIKVGENFDHKIKNELESADIILLLTSTDFLASNYCQDVEMVRALEKNKNGDAKIIPIILDICDWKHSELKNLKVIPRDGKPITKYGNRKEAYQEITDELRAIASKINSKEKEEIYYRDNKKTYADVTYNSNNQGYDTIKNTLLNMPQHASNGFDHVLNVINYIEANIKGLVIIGVILLVLVSSMKGCASNRRNINDALNASLDMSSVQLDFNSDNLLDKATLLFKDKNRESGLGLYIFLTDEVKNIIQFSIYKSGFTWSGARGDDLVWLSKHRDTSLNIHSQSLESGNIQRKLTLAYRNGEIVVAGYNLEKYQATICDINFLTGVYIINDQTTYGQKEYYNLQNWELYRLPNECKN